jgi:hypothetical protein
LYGGGAVPGFIVRAQNRTFELKSQAFSGKIIPGLGGLVLGLDPGGRVVTIRSAYRHIFKARKRSLAWFLKSFGAAPRSALVFESTAGRCFGLLVLTE